MNVVRLKFLLCLVLPVYSSPQSADKINKGSDLVKYITERAHESKSYYFPEDNSEYFLGLEEDKVHDYGTFDFVIIGSGSTGSVLANRLSSVNSWKILLLEAGEDDDPLTDIPAMGTYLLRSKHNWGYNTTTQKYGCKGMINDQCTYARGKILGGSSSINGLVYTRGHPKDYDNWENLGNPGWSYKDVEPYFRKIENAQFIGNNLGHSGPLYINYTSPFVPLQKTFVDAFSEKGIFPTEYNSGKQIGTSRLQMNIKRGRRVSGYTAYIKPVLHRKNLNVTTKALVTKILLDSQTKIANGVRFVRNKRTFDVFANKEIILSAGAINSPQILMLSGIGPKYLLNKHNIPLVKDLPVGETLFDHTLFSLQFLSSYTQDWIPLSDQLSDFLKGEGILTTASYEKSLSFVHEDHLGRPTVEYVLIPPSGGIDYLMGPQPLPYIRSITENMNETDVKHIFTMTIYLQDTKSSGKVFIRSSNPRDFPEIDANILSVQEDVEALYEAIQFAINITKTEPFRKMNTSVSSSVPPCLQHELHSKQYWYCVIKYMAIPGLHSMGTTSMGMNPRTSVVNHELKVHGIRNLRVADCGVMPASVIGHTSGPAFMVGEKVSSMIEKEYLGGRNNI